MSGIITREKLQKLTAHSSVLPITSISVFFVFFLFYDNFSYMSNMFFQLLAWESMG